MLSPAAEPIDRSGFRRRSGVPRAAALCSGSFSNWTGGGLVVVCAAGGDSERGIGDARSWGGGGVAEVGGASASARRRRGSDSGGRVKMCAAAHF